MRNYSLPHWSAVHTLVFDFDGVFTDNKVWVDENGYESVCCNRSDGLAFDLLRGFVSENNWPLEYFILSRECNPVVLARADKLRVKCYDSVANKNAFIKDYLYDRFGDCVVSTQGLVYLGNDLNDLEVMQNSGFVVAPGDAHPIVQQYSTLVLPQKGGEAFVRAFIEDLLGIDKMDIDSITRLLL